MTAIAYPTGLPTFLSASKSRSQPASFTESNPRRGPAYAQKIGTDVPVLWDVTFRFNQGDAQRFHLWVRLEKYLDGGINEFILPIQTEFGMVDHVCRFLSDKFLDAKQESSIVFTYTATILARSLKIPQEFIDISDIIVELPNYQEFMPYLDIAVNQEWPKNE